MRWDPSGVIDELDLVDSVRITGYVPDGQAVELMNLADGFVYPSFYEGFGLPPLEAMACGAPTLVSNAASLPEVVGDGALTVDPGDVEAMADGLVRLATDEDLRGTLAQRGRKRAAEFTWDRAARQLLTILAELVVKSGVSAQAASSTCRAAGD